MLEKRVVCIPYEKVMTNATNTYDPWGKPGAGAPLPRPEHKKQKFTEYDGFKNDVSVTGLFDNMGFHMPSPRENLSPRSLQESQAKIDSYRQELRMVRADRAKNQTFEFFDPWGKGQGNPRREADGYVQRKKAAIRERGIVPQLDSEADRISTNALMEQNNGVGLDTMSYYGGGGAPAKTKSGNVKTRFPTTMKRDIYGNVNLEEGSFDPFKSMSTESPTTYFPFGKPGGGAPMMSDDGRVAPQRRGVDFNKELDTMEDANKRREAADKYLVELKKDMNHQRKARELERADQLAPFGELASVVRQGKVGFPQRDPTTGHIIAQHKATSDVTKHKMGVSTSGHHRHAGVHGENNSNGSNPREYYEELSQLAEQRHRQRQREKELDLQEETKHSQNWTDLWGKARRRCPNCNKC
ncbi:hypothetical protein EB796_007670 [Bugula neritina]|uniref:Uncharacterized protein n=1 Tax=Bugula neritina TaxID=10212 RepID=A0A7J7K5X4_BUGNE|nr:hypothetical protein EB796_007670 [Bugula neritina]